MSGALSPDILMDSTSKSKPLLRLIQTIIACFAMDISQSGSLGVQIVINKYYTHKPLICAWVPGCRTYLSIQYLNQSHFLTIRMNSNHNSMFCPVYLSIWLTGSKNCVTDKYHTHKPLTCAWVPGRRTYLCIPHLNQSHFLTIRMDSKHNSMFCPQSGSLGVKIVTNKLKYVIVILPAAVVYQEYRRQLFN